MLSLTGDQKLAIFGSLVGGLFLIAVYAGAIRALIYFVCDRVRQPQREAAFLQEQIRGVGASAPTVTLPLDEVSEATICSPLGHPDLVPTPLPVDRFSHCDLCGRSDVHRTVWLDASYEEGLSGAFVDVCAACYADVEHSRGVFADEQR
ncbi:hypothetical protein [Luteimonas panaciterrae]|uniref:hypothetical protein n=1 Tax=Luteimonas panaciterrae TaxID=363885 RepID=UPI001CFADC36|nr:hypothetical protein [Luteimonas panaciterrae]